MSKKEKKLNQHNKVSIGPSETTREPTLFHFSDFIENYQPEQLRNRSKQETVSFLEWFVGFSEGDGSFERRISDGRLRLSFTIKQMDPQLLYKVKAGLGFGTVREDHGLEGLYRFTVENQTGIRRLMALFNGNLVLPKVRRRYEIWVTETALWPDFPLSKNSVIPSLKTAWISGFVEAEGCFYAGLGKPSPRFVQEAKLRQNFTVTQKDVLGEKKVLEEIRDCFASKTKITNPKPSCCRTEITSIKSQQLIADYFRQFCLKGKKKITFFRWWRILLLRSDKVHYEKANQFKLKRLVNSLNASTKKQLALKEQIRTIKDEFAITD